MEKWLMGKEKKSDSFTFNFFITTTSVLIQLRNIGYSNFFSTDSNRVTKKHGIFKA